MFLNRYDSGQKLATRLSRFKGSDAVVMAIPRGGVVVGAQVASKLNLTLGLIIPRKIGAPDNPELAIGAVAGEGETFMNERLINAIGVSEGYIKNETKRQVEESKRRRNLYLAGKKQPKIKGKTIIVVDDGIATGATAIAAVRAVKNQKPEKVVLAVPVAPLDSKNILEKEADEVIVLEVPPVFYAVGQFYESFDQTTDDEVKKLMSDVGD